MIWAALPLLVSLTLQEQDSVSHRVDSAALSRIRQALTRPNPLQVVIPEPTFREVIQERTLERAWEKHSETGGPIPPGGLYAFEQRQRLGNPWAGQPMIQIDVLPLAERIFQSVRHSHHAQSERAAHEEVLRTLAEFCIANACEATTR